MTPPEHTTTVAWRKSSRSESQTQCVEVAHLGGPAPVQHAINGAAPAPTRQAGEQPNRFTTGDLDG